MSAGKALVVTAALLAAAPALAAKRPLGAGERIDLNRASPAELMRLPGVGAKRAQAIVAARSRRPFRRPEDVLGVKGFGRAWLAKVRGSLVVDAPTASAPGGSPSRR